MLKCLHTYETWYRENCLHFHWLSWYQIFQGKFAKHKRYVGHSAHVTNVRWSADDKLLVSTGGADTAVMVWQCSSAADRNTTCGESDDSDTDSEEEGGKEK